MSAMDQLPNLVSHWPLIQQGLASPDEDFDLSELVIREVLDKFNIKVQACSSGFICFQGHSIGLGQHGGSSGCAFCRYLRQRGFSATSTVEEVYAQLFVP